MKKTRIISRLQFLFSVIFTKHVNWGQILLTFSLCFLTLKINKKDSKKKLKRTNKPRKLCMCIVLIRNHRCERMNVFSENIDQKIHFFHKLNLICFFERKEIFVKLEVQKIFASGLFALYSILMKKTRIISRLQFLFSVIFTKQWRWTNRKLRFSLFLNETLLYYTKLKLFFFLKLDFQCICSC